MPFVGWTLTTLILPPLADKIGRKWITFGSILLLSTCLAFLLFSRKLWLTITLMFICGMCSAGRASVGFVYGNEFLTPFWRNVFSTLFVFIDGFSVIMAGIYFSSISQHYAYFSMLGPFLGFISCFGLVYLPESPLWQLKVGRVAEAKLTLFKMSAINGIDCSEEIEALSNNESQLMSKLNNTEVEMETSVPLVGAPAQTQSEQNVMFFLGQRVIIVNLIVMCYMWASTSFSYYMISLYMKYLPGNIFVNTIASGSGEFIAYALGGILYSLLGIKKAYSLLYAISSVGGILILIVGTDSETWMPVFCLISKFGVAGCFTICYISNSHVFPTLFCATAIGICNFASRFLSIFSAEIAEVQPPIPMVLFSSITAFGIIMI
jgi:MFS family permease